jgi:DNA (cytosine-5)-methyltransferase 1
MVYRNGNQAHSAKRRLDEPAPTIHFGARSNKVEWMDPELAEDPAASGIRVTVEEAALLQSFPEDYVWVGSRTAQYEIVGNAVPPKIGEVFLRAILE